MSLRKSFIKPRPGAYSVADTSEKKQINLSLPFGRKLSAKTIDPKDNSNQASFNIGGRRLPIPSEGRKPAAKIESFDQKRQPPKHTIYKPNDSKSFGASSSSILQNNAPAENAGQSVQKKSMR